MSTSTKVLLSIDDDEMVLEIIKTTLQITAGWTVITAKSGQDGLHKAITQPLDAILLDMDMPNFNGIETLHTLRINPVTLHIPVIFLTSSCERITTLSPPQLGFSGVINKPFDPRMLANKITTVLGWSQL